MSASPKKRKGKKATVVKLPKNIRDELRMTVALRAYSKIKCGTGKKKKLQELEMSRFFHGLAPNYPSQIKLLADASYTYACLYDEELLPATKKNDSTTTTTQLTLKSIILPGTLTKYQARIDITHLDLEKRLRTGKELISGRKLLMMAKEGTKQYKKALSYCAHRWDLKTGTPLDSGHTVEDVIEYVRCKMYNHLQKFKKKDDSSVSSSDDEITDKNMEEADNMDNESPEKSIAVNLENVIDSENNSNQEEVTDTTNAQGNVEEQEDDDVPDDFIFPSFYAFVVYGPFVEENQRLSLLLTDDADKKKGEGSRTKMRESEKAAKKLNAAHDQSTDRGFSTDQRINIEHLNVQQQMMEDRRKETSMVALSIESSEVRHQLEAAEKRALQRCPEYDPNNNYWETVNKLIEDQEEVVKRIRALNKIQSKKLPSSNSKDNIRKFLDGDISETGSKKRNFERINMESSGDSESDDGNGKEEAKGKKVVS